MANAGRISKGTVTSRGTEQVTSNLFDITGKVALVTGGNSGIGRAIALGFAEAGAAVAILGRRRDKNASVLEELRTAGASAMSMEVDLGAHNEVASVVTRVEDGLGPLSILVNNAAVTSVDGSIGGLLRLAETPGYIDRFNRVMQINITGTQLLTAHAARSMVARRSGKIINLLAYTNVAYPAQAWMASKAALARLTTNWAAELAPHNIHVNGIAPGWIETEMPGTTSREGQRYRRWLERTPLGRMGQPDDIVGTAIYLASPASDYVTGAIISVDGGFAFGL
jgi:2-deoxy-D-gluconate 3-dehydrogenase